MSDQVRGSQTFGVLSWQDMFRKLAFEMDEFEATRSTDRDMAARSYRALNLAWTAWHLHDWLFEFLAGASADVWAKVELALPTLDFSKAKNDRDRLSAFGRAVAERFNALRICRTLATAGKHAKATNLAMPELSAEDVCPIPWMPVGPNGPVLQDVRILVGKQPWDALDLFRQASADWRELFARLEVDLPDV